MASANRKLTTAFDQPTAARPEIARPTASKSDAVAQGTVRGAVQAASAGTGITYQGISVSYKGTTVLFDFNLTIQPGEVMALIGPSGSGKTTALRVTAGFVHPATGRVHFGGRDVTNLPPYARRIGMVVQNYALFPHMRVADNVAFGLRARHAPESIVRERIRSCLAMVGMETYIQRYPRELSGGQQQRVAIARALAVQPEVLLLDEPLSALDAQIRLSMVEELARLHQNLPSLTVLYVTHDQSEAITLADRIAIMRDGRLVALGDSHSLYHRPPNRFAAEFLGRANLFPVTVEHEDTAIGVTHVRFGAVSLTASRAAGFSSGTDVLLCIRPHDMHLEAGPQFGNRIVARVAEVRWKGAWHDVGFEVDGHKFRVVTPPLKQPPEPGATLTLHFSPEDVSLIPMAKQ